MEIDKGSERALDYLKTFCHRVKDGLGTMSFEERQDLLRSVVESISVENDTVRVETMIPFGDNDNQSRTRHGELVEPPSPHHQPFAGVSFDKLRMGGFGTAPTPSFRCRPGPTEPTPSMEQQDFTGSDRKDRYWLSISRVFSSRTLRFRAPVHLLNIFPWASMNTVVGMPSTP